MTTDVIQGQAKNGTIIINCLPTGYYITNDCTNCHATASAGLTDTMVESKYDNRFDDLSYYGGISGTVIGS